jgi:hypothetical protein
VWGVRKAECGGGDEAEGCTRAAQVQQQQTRARPTRRLCGSWGTARRAFSTAAASAAASAAAPANLRAHEGTPPASMSRLAGESAAQRSRSTAHWPRRADRGPASLPSPLPARRSPHDDDAGRAAAAWRRAAKRAARRAAGPMRERCPALGADARRRDDVLPQLLQRHRLRRSAPQRSPHALPLPIAAARPLWMDGIPTPRRAQWAVRCDGAAGRRVAPRA